MLITRVRQLVAGFVGKRWPLTFDNQPSRLDVLDGRFTL